MSDHALDSMENCVLFQQSNGFCICYTQSQFWGDDVTRLTKIEGHASGMTSKRSLVKPIATISLDHFYFYFYFYLFAIEKTWNQPSKSDKTLVNLIFLLHTH